jgi:DNA adenine methylase
MFPYIGGKAHHVKWLDPLFPNTFPTFVEVFGGAGWVSVKSTKVAQATTRVYNDFNPLLANVYECLRRDPAAVLAKMNSITKSDPVLYSQYQQELFGTLDWTKVTLGDLDLCVKYLYLQTQVFAGTPLSIKNTPYFTETKAGGKYPSKYDTLKNKLNNQDITDRLNQITTVEQLDCIDLIKKYDSPDTFFYVDPPYYNMEFYYSKDFPKEKHEELANTLANIQGKFALSYYDFDELHSLYPEDKFVWHKQEVYRSAATRSGNDANYKTKSKGTEILIMNYNPVVHAIPPAKPKKLATPKKNQKSSKPKIIDTGLFI